MISFLFYEGHLHNKIEDQPRIKTPQKILNKLHWKTYCTCKDAQVQILRNWRLSIKHPPPSKAFVHLVCKPLEDNDGHIVKVPSTHLKCAPTTWVHRQVNEGCHQQSMNEAIVLHGSWLEFQSLWCLFNWIKRPRNVHLCPKHLNPNKLCWKPNSGVL